MKIFLYDAESDYELQDEELNLEQAITEFYELSDIKGSFFGIKNVPKTIQFAWEEEDKWLVDVLYDMKNFICLQKYASFDECVEIIKSLFDGQASDKIEGFVKVNIMESDLDETLANL